MNKTCVAPKGSYSMYSLKFLNNLEKCLFYFSSGTNVVGLRYLLLKGVNINTLDEERVSALHVCSRLGSVEMLEEIIQYGASINIPDLAGWTSLHVACYFKRPEIILLLLKNYSNLLTRNRDGECPFDLVYEDMSCIEVIGKFVKSNESLDLYLNSRIEKILFMEEEKCSPEEIEHNRKMFFNNFLKKYCDFHKINLDEYNLYIEEKIMKLINWKNQIEDSYKIIPKRNEYFEFFKNSVDEIIKKIEKLNNEPFKNNNEINETPKETIKRYYMSFHQNQNKSQLNEYTNDNFCGFSESKNNQRLFTDSNAENDNIDNEKKSLFSKKRFSEINKKNVFVKDLFIDEVSIKNDKENKLKFISSQKSFRKNYNNININEEKLETENNKLKSKSKVEFSSNEKNEIVKNKGKKDANLNLNCKLSEFIESDSDSVSSNKYINDSNNDTLINDDNNNFTKNFLPNSLFNNNSDKSTNIKKNDDSTKEEDNISGKKSAFCIEKRNSFSKLNTLNTRNKCITYLGSIGKEELKLINKDNNLKIDVIGKDKEAKNQEKSVINLINSISSPKSINNKSSTNKHFDYFYSTNQNSIKIKSTEVYNLGNEGNKLNKNLTDIKQQITNFNSNLNENKTDINNVNSEKNEKNGLKQLGMKQIQLSSINNMNTFKRGNGLTKSFLDKNINNTNNISGNNSSSKKILINNNLLRTNSNNMNIASNSNLNSNSAKPVLLKQEKISYQLSNEKKSLIEIIKNDQSSPISIDKQIKIEGGLNDNQDNSNNFTIKLTNNMIFNKQNNSKNDNIQNYNYNYKFHDKVIFNISEFINHIDNNKKFYDINEINPYDFNGNIKTNPSKEDYFYIEYEDILSKISHLNVNDDLNKQDESINNDTEEIEFDSPKKKKELKSVNINKNIFENETSGIKFINVKETEVFLENISLKEIFYDVFLISKNDVETFLEEIVCLDIVLGVILVLSLNKIKSTKIRNYLSCLKNISNMNLKSKLVFIFQGLENCKEINLNIIHENLSLEKIPNQSDADLMKRIEKYLIEKIYLEDNEDFYISLMEKMIDENLNFYSIKNQLEDKLNKYELRSFNRTCMFENEYKSIFSKLILSNYFTSKLKEYSIVETIKIMLKDLVLELNYPEILVQLDIISFSLAHSMFEKLQLNNSIKTENVLYELIFAFLICDLEIQMRKEDFIGGKISFI